jgi:LysR family glycine cleavage system transcriptional activator
MMRLPPFDALIAFDAAVRHGSMTLAAAELGLTQSAVSHRLRRLESYMGVTLLRRHNTGLRPTPAGEALVEGLAELLDHAADLQSRCRSAAAPNRLRVGIGAALADHWLVGRLPEFADAHPHISVELVVVENEKPERCTDLDVRVLWVPLSQLRTTTTQLPLFQEAVFPVCHPSLLPPEFIPGDPALLMDLPLLHKGRAGRDSGAEWSWSSWFQRLGLAADPKEALRFALIGPALAAAHQGAGAMLARSMLVHDALAEERLVRLLPAEYDMRSSKAHVVQWLFTMRDDPRVRAFTAWLAEKARQTEATESVDPPQHSRSAPATGSSQRRDLRRGVAFHTEVARGRGSVKQGEGR